MTVEEYQKDPLNKDILAFEMELQKKFPDYKRTSGYRAGAKTKSGNISRHGKGEAIDVRYNPEISEYLWNTLEGVSLLNKYNLGYLDESTPEVMKRTGASGKHFHIGKDSTLIPKTQQRYLELLDKQFKKENTNISIETQSITPQISNLADTQNLPTLAQEEILKVAEKPQENESKEKTALLQKQKEHEFLQEILGKIGKGGNEESAPQQEQQLPQIDILQQYAQISQLVENPIMQKGGQIPTSKDGVHEYGNQPVIVPSPSITMSGVDYPILGKSLETGEQKVMMPGIENYFFKDTENVLEVPMMQQGGRMNLKDITRSIQDNKITQEELNSVLEYTKQINNNNSIRQEEPLLKIDSLLNLRGKSNIKDQRLDSIKDIESVRVQKKDAYINKEDQKIKDDRKTKENIGLQDMLDIIPELRDNPDRTVTINGDTYTSYGELPEIEINIKKKFDIDNIREGSLDSLSKDDLINVQAELDRKGLLKTNYPKIEEPTGKDNIKQVQELLVRRGYDLGKYGLNKDGVDGIIGKATKKAIQEYNEKATGVDGQLGGNTKEAFKEYKQNKVIENSKPERSLERFFDMTDSSDIVGYQNNLEKQGFFKGVDNVKKAKDSDIEKRVEDNIFGLTQDKTCSDSRCTYFVGKEIEKKVKAKGREDLDAYGDAWTITDRLINKGAEELYSVFSDTKPTLSNNQIEPYLKGRISETKPVDINIVKSGDVVNLFYEGSGFKNEAYQKGKKYFTSHLGIVKEDNNGNKIVEHNVGGKIFREPLEELANNRSKNKAGKQLSITAITRPNYNLTEKQEFYDSKDARINEQTVSNFSNLGSKEAAKFTQTLILNKEGLQKDIPINNQEFENLTRAAKAIGWKESGFDNEIDKYSGKKILGELRENIGGKELSRGVTQMKDQQNLTENLRDKYIKGKGQNLQTASDSAIPTFYALSSRYLYLKDLATIKSLKVTSEELTKLAMLAWNEPIDVVAKSFEKYKSYDNTLAAYRGETGKHNYDLALTAFDDYLK